MMRRMLLAAGVIGGASILAAGAPVAGESRVVIDNFSFSPAALTVAVGTKVTWTNRDDIPHTVTDSQTPRAFRSQPLDSGESFSFTFERPGTYRYFCSLHPHMQGSVVVSQ